MARTVDLKLQNVEGKHQKFGLYVNAYAPAVHLFLKSTE